MNSRVPFLTLSLVLLLVFAAPADAAKRCSARGEHVVLENKQARLFWVKGKGETKRRYLGCRRGQKPILVARDKYTPERGFDPYSSVTNRRFRLSGRWVAWIQSSYVDFGVGEFGRTIKARPLGGGGRRVTQAPGGYHAVSSLAVQRSGAVAWILHAGVGPNGLYAEVGGVAPRARVADTLAYARGIARRSLRFESGAGVSWRQDGAVRQGVLQDDPAPADGTPGPQRLDARFGTCGVVKGPGTQSARRLAHVPGGGTVAAGTGPTKPGLIIPVPDSWVVARVSDDGKLDDSFGGDGAVEVGVPTPERSFGTQFGGLAVQPDGKIVLAGHLRLGSNDEYQPMLARLDTDGTLDETFGNGGIVEDALPGRSMPINDITLTPTGEILAAGSVRKLRSAGGSGSDLPRLAVARFQSDGRVDSSFGSEGVASTAGIGASEANVLRLLADGSIVAAGRSDEQFALVRLRPDGSLDPAFGGGDGETFASPPGSAAATALAVAGDGSALVAGTATNVNGYDQLALGRFGADGSVDASFGRDGFRIDRLVRRPQSIAFDSSGRLVASAAVGEPYNGGLARYLADGSRDLAFGSGGRLFAAPSQGNSGDVLLSADGTALLARHVDGQLSVVRFAVEEPALSAAPGACSP